MAKKQTEDPTFETALKQLETAVDQLEKGTLPLSEALQVFEKGLKASNRCRSLLEDARQRVEVLQRDSDGEFALVSLDFDDENFGDE